MVLYIVIMFLCFIYNLPLLSVSGFFFKFDRYALIIKWLKSPNSTHIVGVILKGAVLASIAEVLAPRSGTTDLRRTPVVTNIKKANIS